MNRYKYQTFIRPSITLQTFKIGDRVKPDMSLGENKRYGMRANLRGYIRAILDEESEAFDVCWNSDLTSALSSRWYAHELVKSNE